MAGETIRGDEEMRRCFDALPAFVQESIIQSGVVLHTPEELKRCAENILRTQ